MPLSHYLVATSQPKFLFYQAYQKQNTDQYATNMVTFTVRITTNHPPKFVEPSYEGFISEDAGVDSLVMESKTSNRPLRVQAKDDDFADVRHQKLHSDR